MYAWSSNNVWDNCAFFVAIIFCKIILKQYKKTEFFVLQILLMPKGVFFFRIFMLQNMFIAKCQLINCEA